MFRAKIIQTPTPSSLFSIDRSKPVYITKTRPFNIMALFYGSKNEKFQMKKKMWSFLLFLVETEIVGTR